MEVDDIIQALGTGRNFRAGVTETLSVTREARHAIGNGADGNSEIEGSEPDWQLPRRVGASERGQRMSFKTVVSFAAVALWCVSCLPKAQSADERLRIIYTEEWKWRLEQFPGLEGVTKPVPDRLPKVVDSQAMVISGFREMGLCVGLDALGQGCARDGER